MRDRHEHQIKADSGEAWATKQAQEGMAFLIAEKSAEFFENARKRAAEWLAHAEGCERRASDYFALAAKFPKAHRDHEYYRKMAAEQMAKAKFARVQLEIEERHL